MDYYYERLETGEVVIVIRRWKSERKRSEGGGMQRARGPSVMDILFD